MKKKNFQVPKIHANVTREQDRKGSLCSNSRFSYLSTSSRTMYFATPNQI